MTRIQHFLFAIIGLGLCLAGTPASAAEMTFQLINDSERPLNMKLFSRSESHQEWPSKTKAYSLRPDEAVQQLKISCTPEEQICWGAWLAVQRVTGDIGSDGKRPTRTTKYVAGAGDRGNRPCTRCCHVCKDGAMTPVVKLNDPDHQAR